MLSRTSFDAGVALGVAGSQQKLVCTRSRRLRNLRRAEIFLHAFPADLQFDTTVYDNNANWLLVRPRTALQWSAAELVPVH